MLKDGTEKSQLKKGPKNDPGQLELTYQTRNSGHEIEITNRKQIKINYKT
jgi:hypothetical protein